MLSYPFQGGLECGSLSQVMQSLKQSVTRTLALRAADPFWQARYYDFNVWSENKFTTEGEEVQLAGFLSPESSDTRVGCTSRRLGLE